MRNRIKVVCMDCYQSYRHFEMCLRDKEDKRFELSWHKIRDYNHHIWKSRFRRCSLSWIIRYFSKRGSRYFDRINGGSVCSSWNGNVFSVDPVKTYWYYSGSGRYHWKTWKPALTLIFTVVRFWLETKETWALSILNWSPSYANILQIRIGKETHSVRIEPRNHT